MKLTIFTPTYNRAHLLPNLYHFLVTENFADLEWIIVDDGSNDGTKKLIHSYIKESKINIKYFWQSNQGKHVAFNKAIEVAMGDLFICIDSDDIYEKGSFNHLVGYWCKINRNDLAGLCFLSRDKNGQLIGTKFPVNEMESDLITLYYHDKVKGDKGIMFNTSILKKFRFPYFEGEKFLTESVLYGEIGLNHKMKCINQVYQIVEYQKNGLSEKYKSLMLGNPKGALKNYSTIMKYNIKGKMKIRATVQLLRFTFINKESWKQSFAISNYDFIFIVLTPIGWILSKK